MKTLTSIILLVHLFLCGSVTLSAEVYYVSSQDEFDQAHNLAIANDSIIWIPGTYFDINLDITKDDIYISSEELGATIFTGFSMTRIYGDGVTFSGFQYIQGNIGTDNVIEIWGSHVLITEVNIKDYTCYKYLVIRDVCQYVDITHCNFENRLNLDDKNILSVLVDRDHPGFNRIRYCSFKNFDGEGGDFGIEPIRIGLSSQGEYDSRTLVEYCYFTRCDGDGEIISNKAQQNVFRYNTFDDNPKSELVLRHGSDAVVYGNFFLNGSGGIRVREGQNYFIFNNYFQNLNSRSIYLQNDASDPLDSIHIAFNTIINCDRMRLGGPGSYPPENVTIANNLIINIYDNAFRDPTGTETFIGNVVSGNIGITAESGIVMTDPLMEVNSEGYYYPTAESPVIDAAQPGFLLPPQYQGMDPIDMSIAMDLMQQARPSSVSDYDIGCSEFPQNVLVQPHVTEENTGPHYDTNTSVISSVNDDIELSNFEFAVFPNPASNNLTISTQDTDLNLYQFDIYHVNGKLVKTVSPGIKMSDVLSIDISDLSPSLYTIYAVNPIWKGQSQRLKAVQFVKK